MIELYQKGKDSPDEQGPDEESGEFTRRKMAVTINMEVFILISSN